MFKNLESKWNARTPKFLHNRTKENLIFQLTLVGVGISGLYLKDWYDQRVIEKYVREQNGQQIEK